MSFFSKATVTAALLATTVISAARIRWSGALLDRRAEWYGSAEARAVASGARATVTSVPGPPAFS
jgi:hypothetical protein